MKYEEHIVLRCNADELAQIDAFAVAASTRWHRMTRSDALRALIRAGLALKERDGVEAVLAPEEPKKKKRR